MASSTRFSLYESWPFRKTTSGYVRHIDTYESLDYMLEEFDSGVTTPLEFYERVMSTDVPKGVVSREIDSWVNIDQTFYLMPILGHTDLSSLRGDGDLRGVHLAALTNQARSQQSTACDLRTNDADDCCKSCKQWGFSRGSVCRS